MAISQYQEITASDINSALSAIITSSTTITGVSIGTKSRLKVMFTSAITGSDTTTPMNLTYNGTSYNVKVCKFGALEDFVASVDSSSIYTYLQAYTTLDLLFDGTQFIIMGNPIVESYKDGMSQYRVWSDGWCEQGGTVSIKTSRTTDLSGTIYYGTDEVTFTKTYSSSPTVQLTAEDGGSGVYFADFTSLSNSSITIQLVGSANNTTCSVCWRAEGYI